MRRGEPRLSALRTATDGHPAHGGPCARLPATGRLHASPNMPRPCWRRIDRFTPPTTAASARSCTACSPTRGLVSEREAGLDDSRWFEYPPSWPRPSVRDAYLFLNANRAQARAGAPRGSARFRHPRRAAEAPADVSGGGGADRDRLRVPSRCEARALKRPRPSASSGSRFAEAARSSSTQLGRLLHEAQQAGHQRTSGRGEALSRSKRPRSSPWLASRSMTTSGGRPRGVRGSPKLSGRRLALRSNLAACCGRSRRARNEHHAARL